MLLVIKLSIILTNFLVYKCRFSLLVLIGQNFPICAGITTNSSIAANYIPSSPPFAFLARVHWLKFPSSYESVLYSLMFSNLLHQIQCTVDSSVEGFLHGFVVVVEKSNRILFPNRSWDKTSSVSIPSSNITSLSLWVDALSLLASLVSKTIYYFCFPNIWEKMA